MEIGGFIENFEKARLDFISTSKSDCCPFCQDPLNQMCKQCTEQGHLGYYVQIPLGPAAAATSAPTYEFTTACKLMRFDGLNQVVHLHCMENQVKGHCSAPLKPLERGAPRPFKTPPIK
jgi:hypothetical protein